MTDYTPPEVESLIEAVEPCPKCGSKETYESEVHLRTAWNCRDGMQKYRLAVCVCNRCNHKFEVTTHA